MVIDSGFAKVKNVFRLRLSQPRFLSFYKGNYYMYIHNVGIELPSHTKLYSI